MKPIVKKLHHIIDKTLNEMARTKVQRTIDPKLWASVSSSISKKYKNDKGASARPGDVAADVLVQRLVAALIIMKQPCPKSWYDIDIFPQWVRALQNARVDINKVIQLYNENIGGVSYRKFTVVAMLRYSYTSGPKLYSTEIRNLTDTYDTLTAPSIKTAIQACIKRFWTPENQQWCKNQKTWKTTEGRCEIRIKEVMHRGEGTINQAYANITCKIGSEPEIYFEDPLTHPKEPEPEQKKWSIRYTYRDGSEIDTSSEWVYADNAYEARQEFMHDHHGVVEIVSVTEL